MFNIYISAIVATWRNTHKEAVVNVLYKHGRDDRNPIADDAALYATTRGAFESAAVGYEEVADDFGLKLSVEKTKGMIVGDKMDVASIQVKGGNLDIVDHFQYLGSNISRDGEVTVEIDYRIA